MSDYSEIIESIIENMKNVIGPVAITQANEIEGLKVNEEIIIKGYPQKIIKNLVEKYKSLMGPVALTLVRKAAKPILEKNPRLKVPEELKF